MTKNGICSLEKDNIPFVFSTIPELHFWLFNNQLKLQVVTGKPKELELFFTYMSPFKDFLTFPLFNQTRKILETIDNIKVYEKINKIHIYSLTSKDKIEDGPKYLIENLLPFTEPKNFSIFGIPHFILLNKIILYPLEIEYLSDRFIFLSIYTDVPFLMPSLLITDVEIVNLFQKKLQSSLSNLSDNQILLDVKDEFNPSIIKKSKSKISYWIDFFSKFEKEFETSLGYGSPENHISINESNWFNLLTFGIGNIKFSTDSSLSSFNTILKGSPFYPDIEIKKVSLALILKDIDLFNHEFKEIIKLIKKKREINFNLLLTISNNEIYEIIMNAINEDLEPEELKRTKLCLIPHEFGNNDIYFYPNLCIIEKHCIELSIFIDKSWFRITSYNPMMEKQFRILFKRIWDNAKDFIIDYKNITKFPNTFNEYLLQFGIFQTFDKIQNIMGENFD